jgi:class 3 adenylate cyclase
MIAGRKMSAIFGFAIVRNFSDCTECLQEDVMVFVNTIAEIVHRAVKDNNGAPNKNIGEAFLLVWRQAGSEVEAHNVQDDAHSSSNRSCHSGTSKGSMADSALKSFIRAALEVQASEHLRKITDHQKIQERLPGFHVSMGFGLHVGWAIEGAIGSMRKIDASYLSPNVNLAARLESGCHQFHVDILISEDTYRLLSPRVQMLCRRLDRVTVKGSEQPMSLYTYDLPPSSAKTVSDAMLKKLSSLSTQVSAAPSAGAALTRLQAACIGVTKAHSVRLHLCCAGHCQTHSVFSHRH